MKFAARVTIFTFIVSFCLVNLVSGAPHRLSVQPKTLGTYMRSGVVVGGIAVQSFSILRVQKLSTADGLESLIIVYGDSTGRPLKSEPGYFHIAVDEKASRVSIDLAQVQKTAVDGKDLTRVFAGSRLIGATEMTMDPLDLSTNISIQLKRPAEVRARTESAKGITQLVIDFRPTDEKGDKTASRIAEQGE